MRPWVMREVAVAVAITLGLTVVVSPAYAIKQFYQELQAKYVKPKSQERNDVALTIAFEQAGCTICHPGDNKHKLTPYGGQVAWRINKFDRKNKKKIQEAFEEVGTLRSDPHNSKSPTYGELFRQGKLPPAPVY